MQYVDAAAAKSLSARLIKAMTMILLIAGVVGCAPPVKVGPDAVASPRRMPGLKCGRCRWPTWAARVVGSAR